MEITQERVLQEYARTAFFDPRKVFDSTERHGQFMSFDDDTAAAIVGLEVVQVGNAEVGVGDVLK